MNRYSPGEPPQCQQCGSFVSAEEMEAALIEAGRRGTRNNLIAFGVLAAVLALGPAVMALQSAPDEPASTVSMHESAESAIEVLCRPSSLSCYDKHEAYGNISGSLDLDLSTAGRVTGARVDTGDAPAEVRECMTEHARRWYVPFSLPHPISIHCGYSGTYAGPNTVMEWDRRWRHR